MTKPAKKDLSTFHNLNAQEKETGKKVPWKERYELILKEFPSVEAVQWERAFRDIDLWGRVIKDILRVDQSAETRTGPGPRPVLDEEHSRDRLRQLMGEDFSYAPFRETFQWLAANRSLRHLATKIGISYVMIHRLLTGERQPDLWQMEQIAKAFNKEPSYFVEYRTSYILGALASQLDKSPETSVDLYKKLSRRI